ncbi:Apoptotic chromatin condensation inducer in the nucleus [Mortierella sp. AD094]|nr:Apoptotic chromatin condensation inducer in the nucleus [Mortierella sp. AD094]
MIDPNALKVTELKAELTARGLPTKGLKKELVTRLEEALAAEGTTKAPAESASDPDVAPKESKDEGEPDQDDDDDEMDATGEPALSESTASEAKEISKVVEPVAEPIVDSADTDVVMDPVPIPTPAENATTKFSKILEPTVGTPTLAQEGLVNTTMEPPTIETASANSQTSSRKHALEADESPSQIGSTTDSVSKANDTPAKKLKAVETNRQESEKIAAAAKESMESDARRRSTAPSPSPAPGSSISMTPVSIVTPATKETPSSSTPSGPVSPTSTRPPSAGRKLDMRSLMEKQIKLAAMDRQPEANNKPVAVSPTTPKALVTKDPEPSEDVTPTTDLPSATTRALAITNFVRPLTVNQVKRMLLEFGEIEVLWMDSIRTHCYVTFKEVASAEKAFSQVKGQVFPKETGKPLEPHFITAEAAAASVEAAEEAQKNGKRPVIYTGTEPLVVAPKRGASITIRSDDLEVIFKRDKVEPAQVIQPAELFKMTKTQPALYYKPAKEPPSIATDATLSTDVVMSPTLAAATETK